MMNRRRINDNIKRIESISDEHKEYKDKEKIRFAGRFIESMNEDTYVNK